MPQRASTLSLREARSAGETAADRARQAEDALDDYRRNTDEAMRDMTTREAVHKVCGAQGGMLDINTQPDLVTLLGGACRGVAWLSGGAWSHA